MTITLDVWEISYKNRCREEKVKEAIDLFRKPLNELGIKVNLI